MFKEWLDGVRSIFQGAMSGRSRHNISDARADVVFLGIDNDTKGNDLSFWIGAQMDGEIIQLPAGTYEDDLIPLFQEMQFGQTFLILEEESFDGIGTIVNRIDTDLSKYPVLDHGYIMSRIPSFQTPPCALNAGR